MSKLTREVIFCQRCMAANDYGREACSRCGTKLFLAVEPRNEAFPLGQGAQSFDEHLLERVSALELAIAKNAERTDRLLDLIERQVAGAFYDHTLLSALADLLRDKGAIEGDALEKEWKRRIQLHLEEASERERFESGRSKMIGVFRGRDRAAFVLLIEEGARHLAWDHMPPAIRVFERALRLDPSNSELCLFLGEHFFRIGQRRKAKRYLRQALQHDATNYRASLLYGIVTGDDGEVDEAKQSFHTALAVRRDSYVAHYGLGRILAAEGEIGQAISHFKSVLAGHPCPEIYFAIGRAYFEKGSVSHAIRHFRKAIELDPRFDEAFYHLGLIYLGRNHLLKARQLFRAALEINPSDQRYRQAIKARSGGKRQPPSSYRKRISRDWVSATNSVLLDMLREDLGIAGALRGHGRTMRENR